ncbi:SDR family oxidoreductase [Chondromyces apiculatus]|uniref:NAD(P)-binding domain-containing protein n=1 Tax=Chondromyces apiculatus DSM 436 TaxID=1192034 RepID=A0A017T255_9BACT|nr:SDR family oxidoreductase [Chondromyces apiculatus]EYF03328.1 Hypothetical protein CAP_5659 [Chondromyces apiculatus DSM 436]
MTTVLVTGATGTIGTQVVKSLKGKDVTLRIGLRDPSKGDAFRADGAEVVAYDYDRPETLEAAFAGVDRVFLMTPFVESALPLVQRAVAAAKAAHVKFILRLSAFGADPHATRALMLDHGQCDSAIKDSGIPWAIVQPQVFQDNTLTSRLPTIKSQNAFYGASKGGRLAVVSSADVGAVAAEILSNPDPHRGQVYMLTGPEALTNTEAAEKLSQVTGRTISYIDLAPEAYHGALTGAGLPPWAADAIVGLDLATARSEASAVTPTVQEILGRPAETFDAFLTRHREQF